MAPTFVLNSCGVFTPKPSAVTLVIAAVTLACAPATLAHSLCTTTRAQDGTATPGGTLSLGNLTNPATISTDGSIAFMAGIDGAATGTAIILADTTGISAAAVGCVADEGLCGEPSPIGGTFSRLFQGVAFTPDVNAGGDVLFLAEVAGGTAPRGLFLRDGVSGAFHVVAAVGDPAPSGGTFNEIGPGSLNSHGDVVFLARAGGSSDADIFRWANGAPSVVVEVGDDAPGGGEFEQFSTEDAGVGSGSSIPVGPVPDIDDAGRIAFRAILDDAPFNQALYVVAPGGQVTRVVKQHDAAPGGGTFAGFNAATLGAGGELAFFASLTNAGPATGGWFAGTPGAYRRAIAMADELDGGSVISLAVSRNPVQALDGSGNVVLWTTREMTGGAQLDALVRCRPDGAAEILVQQGDAAPGGGTIGAIGAWPSASADGRIVFSAMLDGAPATTAAYLVIDRCAPNVAGDVDGNGIVDVSDLVSVIVAWGPCGAGAPCAADLDGDGAVGVDDLVVVITNWG